MALHALTARTAGRLRTKLDETIRVGRAATSAPAARGVTWVKVTGAVSSGWHPGLVSLDADGTFTDLDRAVEVRSADGSELATDSRYLCTRTKNKADGTARFRAFVPGGPTYFDEAFPTGDYTFADSNFNDVTGCSITVPATGRYRVSATWKTSARATTVGCGPIYGRIRVNSTDYFSVAIHHPQAVTTFDVIATGFYAKTLDLTASDVVKMQAARFTPAGAWAAGAYVSSQSHIEICRV